MRSRTSQTRGGAFPGRRGRVRIGSVGCIGPALLLAQLLSGQVPSGGVGWLEARHERYERRFQELLLAAPSRDLSAGWQLARDLGRPAAPLLWEMLRAERSSVDRRLVLLAAAVLAGGQAEDERVFEWLAQQRPMLEERVLASFLLALGPRRSRPVPGFWARVQGPTKSPEQLLAVAMRLAAARFPGSEQGAPSTLEDDPGLMAAAAFAGLPVSATVASRMWRQPGRHAELFHRGALLGEGWRLTLLGRPPTLLDRAQELLEDRDDLRAESRAAAMLLRARAGVLDERDPRPDWNLLQLAASQPANAAALREWLVPGPLPRDERPERLAVAFAWRAPESAVLATLPQWSREPRIRRALALAFACRLCAARTELQLPTAVPDLPEWAFVTWANGGAFAESAALDDAHLAALAGLCREGRVEPGVVRTALEEWLWRSGAHPSLGPWELERVLLRDLLLAGSDRGGGKYQPHVRDNQRYFPTGLDREDPFFTIAVELYEFLRRPTSPMPAECRWR